MPGVQARATAMADRTAGISPYGSKIVATRLMASLVDLDGVSHFYGPAERALGPLTLEIPETSVGLLGPNGSGKSTLIRILLGLLTPSEGRVRVLGQAPGPELHRRIGYAPEGQARFPELTGIENVAYAGRLVGMSRSDAMQRAHQVLDYVGLDEERYRQAQGYSTGMRQRLKLAQALVHDPDLLILDEPTEGVDPQAREHLLDLLAELQREHGLRLLIATHLLGDVERLAEHAVVLDDGEVAVAGEADALQDVEASAYVVAIQGDTDAFTAALDEAGVAWEPRPPRLKVEITSPRRVVELADQAGVVVRHIDPVQRGLADALMEAVGQRSADLGPPASRSAGNLGGELDA